MAAKKPTPKSDPQPDLELKESPVRVSEKNWNDPTGKRWKAKAICCNFDEQTYYFDTWAEADTFREQFTSGFATDPRGFSGDGHNGHRRAVIVEEAQGD